MQELRLMGVHEDGDHLLFGDDAGAMYKVRIDETLRVATQRVPRRQARQTPAVKVPLSPREIQARIRAGASAEQIAVESGYDLDHIRRYETPVRAERDWLAGQARQVEVASPSHHDEYRAAFGDQPASLDAMVTARLRALSVDPATVQWDAWRRQDGAWDVVARFDLPEESAIDLGEQPPARWIFDPSRKHLTNANRWAQVLSELEPLSGPIPPRRLTAVNDAVFDVESQPEVEDESADLLDVLRSRRGQRLGSDEDGDDALALLLSRGPVPAAHPRPGHESGQGADGDEQPTLPIDDDGQQVPDPGTGATDTAETAEGDASIAAPSREGHRWGSGRSRLRGRNRRGDAAEDVSVDDLLGFERGAVPGNETGADATGGDAEPHTEGEAGASDPSAADSPGGAPADVTTDDGTTESEGVAADGAAASEPTRSGQERPTQDRPGQDRPTGSPSAAARGTSAFPTETAKAEEPAEDPKKVRPQDGDQAGKGGKARRSSVPSWDEIVFGKRGD